MISRLYCVEKPTAKAVFQTDTTEGVETCEEKRQLIRVVAALS